MRRVLSILALVALAGLIGCESARAGNCFGGSAVVVSGGYGSVQAFAYPQAFVSVQAQPIYAQRQVFVQSQPVYGQAQVFVQPRASVFVAPGVRTHGFFGGSGINLNGGVNRFGFRR
jgi:hypothetical protein